MSFSKRLLRALGGDDPRANDAQKEAADELRRVQSSARPGGPPPGGPGAGGPGPSSPGPGGPGPGGPGSGGSAGPGPSGPAPGPSRTPSPAPSPRPSTGPSGPPPSARSTRTPSDPGGPPPPSPSPPPGPDPSARPTPGPDPSAGPTPEGPGIRSGAGASPGGAAPPPFAAPGSTGQALTPEEERRALNEMALDDLGGPAAYGGGLQVNPAEAESMRDRALAQYMQRKEEFDRFREREAQRHAAQQPESSAEDSAPQLAARRQGQAAFGPQPGSQTRSTAKKARSGQPDPAPEGGSIEEQLAEVPGLGPAKIRALHKEFGSLDELQQAGEEDLLEVTGIGQQLAREILRALR